jgi:serine/threonine protein kinase
VSSFESLSPEREEGLEDSHEEKVIVGKTKEQLRIRKLLKERLSVTQVPKLIFEELRKEGIHRMHFEELYQFEKFLGIGSFGFVVAARDVTSKELLALKIVETSRTSMISSLKNEA